MYRDYPISPTLFHWESQSTTWSLITGQRYLHGASKVFCSSARAGGEYGTAPYLFPGPPPYVQPRR